MLLDNIVPIPELSEWIRLFRIADFVFSGPVFTTIKAYPPRPQECLHFYPRDTEIVRYDGYNKIISGRKTSVTGQHTITNNRTTGKNFLVFQVVFQPGALYRLTGIPAREIVNSYIDAEDIFGKEVCSVNEQLYDAVNYGEMVSIVERYLLVITQKQKKSNHFVDRIARMMIQDTHGRSLDYFLKEACLSPRQFDRMFKERMGINPHLFTRIIKFDRAFRLKNRYSDKDWLSIAIHSGYYDYQHLAKAYKIFTGYTPREFYKIETRSPERFFGDKEI